MPAQCRSHAGSWRHENAPTASDSGDHLGLMFADPSQDEECRFCADLIEKIKGKLSVPVHAASEAVPVIGRDDPAHRSDMTVVLENNANTCWRADPSASADNNRILLCWGSNQPCVE